MEGGDIYLTITYDDAILDRRTSLVTTRSLGKTDPPPDARFENPDGTPLILDHDYFGKSRSPDHPTAGPFETPGSGPLRLKVWGAIQ
jgi:alpha-N-arabinofuranosidase